MRSPPTSAAPRSSSNTISIPTTTGSNLTPSSSPEPGTSPHGLAAHGWQSFIDEKDEKWNITGDEGVRLIEKEDDCDDDEDEDEDEDEENKSSDDDKYTGDVNSDDTIDIFTVTKDQLKYYCDQFTKLTCTDNAYSSTTIVTGKEAKEFFEKSKLPVEDLSKIWMLADQDQDGCLKLVEFCIAMHLVVLRRNSVDLPSTLPSNLLVSCNRLVTNHSGKCLKSNSNVLLFDPLDSSPAPEVIVNRVTKSTPLHESARGDQQQRQQYLLSDINNSTATSWTRFSPTSPILASPNNSHIHNQKQRSQQQQQQANQQGSSNVVAVSDGNSSSNEATPAPVNFDFQPVSMLDRDPKVIYPIARRLTPEVPHVSTCVNGIASLKFPLPPPPPPRTSHRHSKHARSSSLDLNHISRGSNCSSQYLPPNKSSSLLTSPTEAFNCVNQRKPLPTPPPPPPPPPPPSQTIPPPQSSSSTSTQVSHSTGSILYPHEPHHGAFTVVRKRVAPNNNSKCNAPLLPIPFCNSNLTSDNSKCTSPSNSSSSCNFYVTSSVSNFTCPSSSTFSSSSTVVPPLNINNTNGNTNIPSHPNESDCYNTDTLDTLLLLRSKYSLPRQSFIPSNPNDHSELIRCMKGLSERAMRLEKLNEQLIDEMITVIRQNQQLESFIAQMKASK